MKKRNKKQVNVNLGCGENVVKDWINIDTHLPGIPSKDFVVGDVREIPLESNTVDYILCDQVLEHMQMSDVPTVLHEIKRVLKKGGRAVICVPDFKSAIIDWMKVDHDQFFNPYLFKFLSEVVYGGQEHEGQFHRSPMTPGFLHYSLNMVGLPKHELTIFPTLSPIPEYPGMPKPFNETARCRNAQLVADITKV